MPYQLVLMHNAMSVNYGVIILSLQVCLMSQSWDNVAIVYNQNDARVIHSKLTYSENLSCSYVHC